MRKRGKWAENVATFGIVVLVIVVAFPAAVYVHENALQWEAAAIFVSLGLGLAPALWYLRTKRHGWLVSIGLGLLLGFSFMSALFHGWKDQALIVVYTGMGVVFVYMVVMDRRLTHRLESAMREEANEDARNRGPVLFRDDGERITVYPNRRRLLLQCAVQALFLAIIAGVLVFVAIDNLLLLWALRLLAGLMAAVFLASLYRLVVWQPTLVVGPDGLFDHGSLIATGLGLIRWDDIMGVTAYATSTGRVTQHYLSILVGDARAIRRNQPLWKRIALRFTTSSWLGFDIWQGLLSVPANELAGQIRRYVETHAPPGYVDEGNEEVAEDGTDAAPSPAE